MAGARGRTAVGTPARRAAPSPARTLSLFAGGFRPADATYRLIYGSKLPVAVQMDWRLTRWLGVFGGVQQLWGEGAALIEDTRAPAGTLQSYDTKLRVTSLRAGAALLLPRGRWELGVGAGVTMNRYREDWPVAGGSFTGNEPGWLVQGRVSRGLSRRLWIGGGFGSTSATAKQADDSALIPSVRLGGAAAFASAGFRF